jgi:hypothetical protein
MERRIGVVLVGLLLTSASLAQAAGNGGASLRAKLAAARPNTWVKLKEETGGSRKLPAFVYDATAKRFILTGGRISKGRRYDTETFDPSNLSWRNFYPEGAPYNKASGPTDAPGVKLPRPVRALAKDKNGILRVVGTYNPWQYEPEFHHQWAWCAKDRRIYVYKHARTIAFDIRSRRWQDLKAEPFSKCLGGNKWPSTFGSLAYDPVNHEILSVGGTSDEDGGTPGTWAFDIDAGKWNRVRTGSKALKSLNASAGKLQEECAARVNMCRNRFYATESDEEAKADLAAAIEKLAAAARELVGKIEKAGLSGREARAAAVAADQGARAVNALKTLAGRVRGKITSELLLAGESAVERLMAVERALDAEPCGRAGSQMAVDPVNGKILLFGGCRMDSYLADTWVYDCKTRTWQQRFPNTCPAPRGGHMLLWLPKSDKVFMAGSRQISGDYGTPRRPKVRPPMDVWTYDPKANRWACLGKPAKLPSTGAVAAADGDDVIVAVDASRKGRITWGMKVDPARTVTPDAGATAGPGEMTFALRKPSYYDSRTSPDPKAIGSFLKGLKPNTWVSMPKSPARGNGHDYSSASYDPVRHQILWWGGGHSRWHYNDMEHYSLRTAAWSIGYPEEYPYSGASFQSPVNQSFNNRPIIETHVWDKVAYDPVSDRVVLCNRNTTWTYDVRRREWEYPMLGSAPGASYKLNMVSTPKGVVAWSNNGRLQLFNARTRTWNRLPLTGAKLTNPGGHAGMCYDSKRNCLWISGALGKTVFQYNMADGMLKVAGKGQHISNAFPREICYVPQIDTVLCISRIKGAGGKTGNLAFDIKTGKWVGLDVRCSDGADWGGRRRQRYEGLTMLYDPAYNLAIYVGSTTGQDVRVARLRKEGLKAFEIPGANGKTKK